MQKRNQYGFANGLPSSPSSRSNESSESASPPASIDSTTSTKFEVHDPPTPLTIPSPIRARCPAQQHILQRHQVPQRKHEWFLTCATSRVSLLSLPPFQ